MKGGMPSKISGVKSEVAWEVMVLGEVRSPKYVNSYTSVKKDGLGGSISS